MRGPREGITLGARWGEESRFHAFYGISGNSKDENLVTPGHTPLSLGELSLEEHCSGISNMLIWGVVMSVRRDAFRG